MSGAVRKIHDSSWGIDLGPGRRPGVPREKNHENGASGRKSHWVEPVLQIAKVPINKTVERPHITPVFSTLNPPRWLSGLIRNYAYKFSEDKMRHWMPLLLADRIDMIEVFLADLFNGKMPQIFGKMELRSITRARQMRDHRRRKNRI